ncbi:alpha-tectorin-like isoform X11, partial [Clarias magur]
SDTMRRIILLVMLLIHMDHTTTQSTVEHTTTQSTVSPPMIQSPVSHTTTQSTGLFYPFGAGDIVNAQSDDGSSSLITLLKPFLYFGTSYNYMYVNNNGHLTFNQSWYSYIPYQFPLAGGRDIIAPFWTDIDNRENGVISYQQFTSGSVLTQATHDINRYFPQLRFNATWVFVATWDRVAYFPITGTETSFQVVLISNDHLSFILMNYGVIAPTSRSVQAGYDTYDSSYYFSIPGSFQYNYTSFAYSSNVNVPGRWAFRVDNGTSNCQFNGEFVPKGVTFWTDSSCQRKCTCTRGGLQCISQPCTFSQACRPGALQYSCQNVQRQTCIIAGDPHIYTFDNQIFHFQGTCTYILSEACSNDVPYYRVEGKNEHRGNTHVAWTRLVKVFVYDQKVELVKDHAYEAKVNGIFTATPFSLHNGSIQVYRSGFSVVISTAFGLVVSYDAYSYVTINVPYDYQNTTCGLCGNFNHHPEDDFRTPLGEILSSDSGFGDSWKAYGDTDPACEDPSCSGFQCANCTIEQSALFRNSDNCGILVDPSGPFANCNSVLSPQTFIDSCVYDLCVGNGNQTFLCHAISVYATQCQHQGVQLGQWRRTGFCEIACTVPHSHYEFQGTSCSATCSDPFSTLNCTLPTQESCICDNGYVLSGGECVPQSNCGCTFEGLYYTEGQSVVLDSDCGRQCNCSNRVMTCHQYQCGPQEVCGINNGVRGCYAQCTSSPCQEQEICSVTAGEYGCHSRPSATCSASGDPHYTSFDGHRFDFQGTCYYTLATVCNDTGGLPYFQVIARNKPWNGLSVSITVEVQVNVSGHLVRVSNNMYGTAEIDGQTRNLPAILESGHVSVYSSGWNTYITTDFGLSVSYDGSWLARVTVPGNYSGATCGLCGNFNDDSNDDFRLQSGALTLSASEFGADWKVGNDTACNHGSEDEYLSCRDPSRAQSLCAIITDNQGPLSFCHAHVDPEAYFNECVFDLCLSEHRNDVLCRSIETYISACQSANVRIYPWRENTTC